MKALYDQSSYDCSQRITNIYSTSFSLGIKALDKSLHMPIYAIYGFVRVADEIVDSFHDFDKRKLLSEFRADTWKAIEEGISLNPVLHAFQDVVNKYNVDKPLIKTFLDSMEMDLDDQEYDQSTFEQYILGSAEVVGLMCLKVFCLGDQAEYDKLKPSAMKLGAAFQKINFLRDLKNDYETLGRSYFPNIDLEEMDENTKISIMRDIDADFKEGMEGILMLPQTAKFGVYTAYVYYYALFKKILKTDVDNILKRRIRISNTHKFALLCKSYVKYSFGLL